MKTYIIQNNSVIDEEKKILSQNYQELGGKTLNKHNPEDYWPVRWLSLTNTHWIILVRVIDKIVKTYQNQKGQGKVMDVVLIDSESTAIQMTAFNKQVDLFQDVLVEGKCYKISKGNLIVSN